MADKKFTLTFDVEGNLSPIKGAVKDFQSTIKSAKFQIPVGIQGNIDKTISKLNAEIAEFESLTSQGFSNMADIGKAEKSFAKITSLMRQLGSQGEQIKGLDPKKFLPKEILDRTAKLEKAFNKLGDIKVNTKKIDAQTEAVRKQKEEVEELKTKYEALAAENKTAGARKGNLSSSIKSKEKELDAVQKQMEALEKVKGGKSSAEYSKLNSEFKALSKTIAAQKAEFASLDTSINKNKTTMSGLKVQLDSASSSLDQMEESLKQLQASANVNEDLENLRKELAQLKNVNIDKIPSDLDEIKRIIGSLDDEQIKTIKNSLEGMGKAADDLVPSLEKTSKELEKTGQEGKELTRVGQEIENLKGQVLDFFSITNTIQIFKNAVRDAFDTVKELDAVMTETAVVTDFSIGDMWDKLPEYSDEANKLGTSISSLYEATTLYYQQGLKSQEAMDVGIETMKMARIANMDAAAATEAMTAALRGFNMEINEMSATRINDVYSELAAITAADTSQIATAMSKTASIAASANMEFETTAALLAQIIETTQEAPETAGTAMKTIIARFTEVKQLFDEGVLTGKDSEGEEININKIDAALKKVGISLSDFLRGEKGIDDIFLELASKWDSLDLATQRYIATTAAGSRQQSRFLAMMSNYGRTMELVTAANNSAGASQKQFDKTLESLEAKLQRLKNAWAEFTMGLANNELIKGAVDLLTEILEKLNQFTDLGSDGIGGVVTMLTRLGTVIMGLKGGEVILNTLLRTLKNENIKKALKTEELVGIKEIFNKIVSKEGGLNKMIAFMKDPALRGESFTKAKEAVKGFSDKAIPLFAKFGPWIALAIALGAAIYGLVKSFKTAQNEAKLDNINQALADLNTEAQNAQDELSEIGSARTELNGLQDTLNGLTKGTTEWKSALVDVNRQVLELIEKYPSLEYELGASGALSIKQESWDNLLAQQQKVIANMTAYRIAAESEQKNIIESIDFDQFVVEFVKAKNEDDAQLSNKERQRQAKVVEQRIRDKRWSDSIDNWLLKLVGPEVYRNWVDMGDAMINSSKGSKVFNVETDSSKEVEARIAGNEEVNTEKLYKELLQVDKVQLELIAKYFADNNITDLATIDQQREALAAGGLSTDEIEGFLPTFSKLLKDSEHPFYDWVDSIQSNTESQQKLTHQFVVNSLANSNLLEKDYADSIVNIISKGEKEAISDQVDKKVTELKDEVNENDEKVWTPEKVAAEYARIMGYQAVGKDVYTDGTYSQKVDASQAAMLRAIATEKITVEVKEKAEKTAGAIGKEKEQEKLFDNLFSTDGQEITSGQIAKYQNTDGTLKYDQIALDITGVEDFDQMVADMGRDTTELIDILTSNFKVANERIATQRKDLAKRMTKYSSAQGKTLEENAQDLAGLETKFGDELGDWIRNSLDSALTSLERTGDEELISEGLEYFRNVAILGTQEEVQELSTLISEIDWSNPIETAHRLNQEIENGSKIAEGFGLAIQQVDSDFLSAQSQFNALFTTGDYEGLSNKLKEIYDTQDAITDADVRGLASEYSYLNKLMKNTATTGAGLADILTSIQKGELSFDAVTDAVIAAVGRMNSLGEATSKVLQKLRELDMGEDTGEVQDKYREFSENIEGWQKEGEYGNPQYENTLNYMFGNDWDVGYGGEQLVGRMDQLSEIAKKAGKDMYYFWDNASNGLDVYGNKVDENAINKLKEAGVLLDNVNGEVVFDIPDEMTFDEITALLQEAFEGSKDLWDDLMIYFENRDPNFRRSWITADYNSMGDRIVESETTEVGGKKVITQQEIEDIATIQAGKTDKTADKVIEDINKQLEKYEGEIVVIPKLEGLTPEEVTQKLNEAFDGGENAFAESFKITLDDGNIALDLGAIMAALQGMGLSSEVAAQVANGIAAGAVEAGQSIVTTVEGQTVEVPVTTETTDFVAAMNEAIEQSQKKANENPINQTASVTIDQATWNSSVDIARSYLIRNISGTKIPITAYVSNIEGLPENTSDNNSGSTTSGSSKNPIGINQVYLKEADGVKNNPNSRIALTGEEGPELIESEDKAYLVGTEGPQMAQLKRGDTVHTAEETKEIYRRKGIKVPAFKGGNMGPVSSLTGGSGGKSSDDEETWENPFDKLYNLLRKIDEELRQRERIERRYEKLLGDLDVSANKIIAINREELAQLERERMLQEQLIEGREYQIQKYQEENSDLQQYARVMENERGEKVLRIDWDRINAVTDTEKGDKIETYVSQLEEWFDDLEGAEDALWDIEDAVAEIKERGKEQYEELENKIKDAVTQTYQEQIDKLGQINDSINETNTELLDAIQESIDKSRQERDNRKTEEEIAEKQRRLLYLQQDTSGANALEIMQLQKEIEESQEDYTDTLIDQKISELQKQNDDAAKQREKQITLMQTQLDHYIKSGEIWNEVYGLMEEGLNGDDGLIRGSRLEEILKNTDNFAGLSIIGQQSWWKEMTEMVSSALSWLETGRQLEDLGVKNQDIELILPNGSTAKGRVDENGNVTTEDGAVYNNVWQGADGRYYAGENLSKSEEPMVENFSDGSMPEDNTVKKNIKNNFNVRREANLKASIIKTLTKGTEVEIDGYKADWYHIIKPLQGFIHKNAIASSIDKAQLKAYKTGGLADFTGPAWLDGSKSRPEIVLNSQDSRNFIQLRDILSSVLNRGTASAPTENSRDITYDIDINVESIGSDYDVEQVASKVKSLINEDARYRNNNAVSLKR